MGDEEKRGVHNGKGEKRNKEFWARKGARPKTTATHQHRVPDSNPVRHRSASLKRDVYYSRVKQRQQAWTSDSTVPKRHVPLSSAAQRRAQSATRPPRNTQGQGKQNGGQFITLETLNILSLQSPDSVARYLSQHHSDLEMSLKEKNGQWNTGRIQWMTKILAVLASVVRQSTDTASLASIIGNVQRYLFGDSLMPFLTVLVGGTMVAAADILQIVENVMTLMNAIIVRSPHMVVTLLGVDVMLSSLLNRGDIEGLSDTAEMKATLEELQNDVKDIIRKRKDPFCNKIDSEEEEEPPDSFRHVVVYPNREELLTNQEPHLRKNKVKGEYRNDEHYLDVQFRLLREDFIRPFRQGLTSLRASLGSTKIDDLRVYPETKVLRTAVNNDGLGYVIQFNTKQLRNVNWENSKRLIFGSLLCLSKDNFDTLLFATVSNSDAANLKRGILEVTFLGERPHTVGFEDDTFVMCESIAFFEAYKHVLRALQSLPTVPFSRHIVKCETDVAAPKYLERNSTYDFTPVIDKDSLVALKVSKAIQRQPKPSPYSKTSSIDVRKLDKWPTAEKLGLDSAQYTALQTALTKEFVVIQGPPGTGKTFLGLQIARAVLHNQFRDKLDARPIFVVCFTNHALDQFLEGIIKFLVGKVIRVGGRSSNESMKKHGLGEERERMRKDRDIPKDIFLERVTARDAVDRIGKMVTELGARIQNIHNMKEFPSINALGRFMGFQYHSLMKALFDLIYDYPDIPWQTVDILFEWLGVGNFLQTVDFEMIVAHEECDEEEVEVPDQGRDADCVRAIDTVQAMESGRILDDLNDDFSAKRKPEGQETGGNTGNQARENRWQPATKGSKKRKKKTKLKYIKPFTANEALPIRDVWQLSFEHRWRLYRYWVGCYLEVLETQNTQLQERYQQSVAEYKRARMREDAYVLKQANVIGMTTTGAARCQQVMKEVGPRVIIVEEAAEVLEAHVVATLSEACEHLLLIGDHQQLRPNPTSYALAKKYHLDISLFERMIDNGIESTCLREQRRMRPAISRLLRHIYPDLMDHECVTRYDHIKGVSSDVFFISHSVKESHDKEQKSHLNEHEARYIVDLCKYLIQQGYAREQITVLTTYSAQLFYIRRLMPKSEFEGVHVTVVDNYQGEENDIILLSLVRSNDDGRIGFLKVHNRMCVALSRAKKGFYVIGNFDFLRNNSRLWDKMVGTLSEEGQIGTSLRLFCQNHKEDGFQAEVAADFQNAPDGGCKRKCDARLQCGHVCTRHCHSYDVDHSEFKCKKSCTRRCRRGHPCPKLCHEECKCMVPVVKEMPECGHSQTMPCSYGVELWECREPCKTTLQCGHLCQAECGQEHWCEEPVEKTLPRCDHEVTIPCNVDVRTIKCKVPCEKDHGCGHTCKDVCHDSLIRKPCYESVESKLSCGHSLTHACHKRPSQRDCTHPCSKALPCGHICTNSCGEDHVRICGVPVTRTLSVCGHEVKVGCGKSLTDFECVTEVNKTFMCGHQSQIKCHLQDTAKCTRPCGVTLECGHKCQGSCIRCDEGRFHQACTLCGYSTQTFMCGHQCKGHPNTTFPCSEACTRRCPHRKCKKLCYELCEEEGSSPLWPCSSDCTWNCPHYSCTNKCGETCNRPPCEKPCPKKLRCGHVCIGLCGEPCPTLCRTCHKDKVTGIKFGRESEPDARFVYLEDCHHIVEVSAMDTWMGKWEHREGTLVVRLPVCPLCRKRIHWLPRYQVLIRQTENDVEHIKRLTRTLSSGLHSGMASNLCDQLLNANSFIESSSFTEETRGRIRKLEARLKRPPPVFSKQMLSDVSSELQRICLTMKAQLVREHLQQSSGTLPDNLQQIWKSLSRGRLTAGTLEMASSHFRQYEHLFPKNLGGSFCLADKELIAGIPLDSWQKCSEGHFTQTVNGASGHCRKCSATTDKPTDDSIAGRCNSEVQAFVRYNMKTPICPDKPNERDIKPDIHVKQKVFPFAKNVPRKLADSGSDDDLEGHGTVFSRNTLGLRKSGSGKTSKRVNLEQDGVSKTGRSAVRTTSRTALEMPCSSATNPENHGASVKTGCMAETTRANRSSGSANEDFAAAVRTARERARAMIAETGDKEGEGSDSSQAKRGLEYKERKNSARSETRRELTSGRASSMRTGALGHPVGDATMATARPNRPPSSALNPGTPRVRITPEGVSAKVAMSRETKGKGRGLSQVRRDQELEERISSVTKEARRREPTSQPVGDANTNTVRPKRLSGSDLGIGTPRVRTTPERARAKVAMTWDTKEKGGGSSQAKRDVLQKPVTSIRNEARRGDAPSQPVRCTNKNQGGPKRLSGSALTTSVQRAPTTLGLGDAMARRAEAREKKDKGTDSSQSKRGLQQNRETSF